MPITPSYEKKKALTGEKWDRSRLQTTLVGLSKLPQRRVFKYGGHETKEQE